MQDAAPNTSPELLDDSEHEHEYEYEYSEVETDVFYLGLDLASSGGLLRRPKKGPSGATAGPAMPSSEPDQPQPPVTDTDNDSDPDTVQILDLHSRNPLISSHNHVFTCSWADTLGTELVFTHPYNEAVSSPLRSHDDYTLISATRAKIIGQKANLISTSKTSVNFNPAAAATASIDQVEAAEPVHMHRTNTSNQARFLESLSQVKYNKGETDAVRAVFPQKRIQNTGDRLQGWARTGAALAEIERLNKQAMEGDSTALANLMQIYDNSRNNTSTPGDQDQDQAQDQDQEMNDIQST